MKPICKLVALVGFGMVTSLTAPAFAQTVPEAAQAQQAAPESIAKYGSMVLHGMLSESDLRDHAQAHCDDLTAGDIAAVQEWIRRSGVNCD